ncbi:MAG: hypothetical protein K2P94_14650 [Rhodospirillaceae bacterium]|nr:hypothetical protein [Rhodospirillaceae bacterium]
MVIDGETLAGQLQERMDTLLHAEGIYPIENHGWLNAEDYDPDDIGHAMWQTDPPPGLDWTLRDDLGEDDSKLEDWKKIAATAGADFDGLMEFARRCIGLQLVHCPTPKRNIFADETFFNLHWGNALLNMHMASDRLRRFFLTSVYRVHPNAYRGRAGGHLFVTPFETAASHLSRTGNALISASAEKLLPLTEAIYGYIEIRNRLVHEVATEMAHRAGKRLDSPPQRVEVLDFREVMLDKMVVEVQDAREARLQERVDQCCNWYKALADLANHVFIIENQYRRL